MITYSISIFNKLLTAQSGPLVLTIGNCFLEMSLTSIEVTSVIINIVQLLAQVVCLPLYLQGYKNFFFL